MILGKIFESKGDLLWLITRVIFGAMFTMHGLVKFGVFGGNVATDPVFILGGIIEIAVGITVLIGILSRLAGLIGALEMLVAFAMFHFPKGLNPLQNGGEAALLYLAFFLCVLAYGSGKHGLEQRLLKKEIF